MVIVKNSSPPPTVGRQSADRSPTVYRQVTVGRQSVEVSCSSQLPVIVHILSHSHTN